MHQSPVMALRDVFFRLVIFTSAWALVACGPMAQHETVQAKGGTISNPESEMYKPEPLMWEGAVKDGLLWSAYVFQIIGAEAAPVLLPGADDIKEFCANYAEITDAQRVNFWAFLVSAIAKYETSFNAQSRFAQAGIDEITGKRLYSEGLLNLSYRDVRDYAFCAFDWEKDKELSLSDVARSILDPIKNLDCGIKILATQVEKSKRISNVQTYWNVLKPTGLKSRLNEIKAAAQKLPFCHK